MSRHQEIAFGVTGQQLRHYYNGSASSLDSVTVYDAQNSDDTAESSVVSSSAIDAVASTLAAAAGPAQSNAHALQIQLADASEFEVGGKYWVGGDVESADGEYFVVERIVTDTLYAQQPLARDHSSGATVVGHYLTATIDSTWVADDANILNTPGPDYRVKWEFTDSGSDGRVAYSYFSLVRAPAAVDVSHFDIDAVVPGYTARLAVNHQSDKGRAALRAALQSVELDLRQEGFDISSIRDPDVVNELVVRRFVADHELARFLAGGGGETELAVAREYYQMRLDSWIKHPSRTKVAIDPDNDGAGEPQPPTRITKL